MSQTGGSCQAEIGGRLSRQRSSSLFTRTFQNGTLRSYEIYVVSLSLSDNLNVGAPMAIKRIWHGWTTLENADEYQTLLHNEIFPGIEAKDISGYQSIELLRFEVGDEVEFVTIMTFDSLQNVVDFQGENYSRCYVPDAAQKVLKRWDETSAHYETVEYRNYQ